MKARQVLLYFALVGMGVVIGTLIDHSRQNKTVPPPRFPSLEPASPPNLFQWSVPVVTLVSAHTNADGGELRTIRLTGLRTKAAGRYAMDAMIEQLGFERIGAFTNETETTVVTHSQKVASRTHVDGERITFITKFDGPTNTVRAIMDSSYVDLPEFGYYVSTDGSVARTGVLDSVAAEYRPLYWLLPDGTNVVQSECDLLGEPDRFLFNGSMENGNRVGTWYQMNSFGHCREVWCSGETTAVFRVSTGMRRENVKTMRFEIRDLSRRLPQGMTMEWEKSALRKVEMRQEGYLRHGITLIWSPSGKLERIEAFAYDKPICLASNITADVWMPATFQDVLPPLSGETGNEWF